MKKFTGLLAVLLILALCAAGRKQKKADKKCGKYLESAHT